MKFKIVTPNEQYNGVTEGLAFANGVAHTEDENLKNVLVNNYGYRAEEEEKPKAKAEAKPKKASGK